MTEQAWQDKVVAFANLQGWRAFHARPARTGDGWVVPVAYQGQGFPDVVFTHESGHVAFVEFKNDDGVLSAPQEAWADHLEEVERHCDGAVHYFVWRPRSEPQIFAWLERRPCHESSVG